MTAKIKRLKRENAEILADNVIYFEMYFRGIGDPGIDLPKSVNETKRTGDRNE